MLENQFSNISKGKVKRQKEFDSFGHQISMDINMGDQKPKPETDIPLEVIYERLKGENYTLESKLKDLIRKEHFKDEGKPSDNIDLQKPTSFPANFGQRKPSRGPNILQKEFTFLTQRMEELQSTLIQREVYRQETVKAINELRSNRIRVEEVLKTMASERTCLVTEIEKLEEQKANSESIHRLVYRGEVELSIEDTLDEYKKDWQELRRQTSDLKNVYDSKCSDLIEYFSGSISQ